MRNEDNEMTPQGKEKLDMLFGMAPLRAGEVFQKQDDGTLVAISPDTGRRATLGKLKDEAEK